MLYYDLYKIAVSLLTLRLEANAKKNGSSKIKELYCIALGERFSRDIFKKRR